MYKCVCECLCVHIDFMNFSECVSECTREHAVSPCSCHYMQYVHMCLATAHALIHLQQPHDSLYHTQNLIVHMYMCRVSNIAATSIKQLVILLPNKLVVILPFVVS